MTDKWQQVGFGELYAEPSKNGLNRPTRVRGTGYKMINMGEIFAHDRINDPQMDRVPMNEREIRDYSVRVGDLFFARQSLVAEGAGKVSIVLSAPETTTFEGHIIRVRLDQDNANPFFYYYFFKSPQGKALTQSIVMQVAAAGIRASDLARLRVPHPPLPIQHRIASILGALDDKIECNRRINQTLEQMAQALYKHWFVESNTHETKEILDFIEIDPHVRIPRNNEAVYVEMKALPVWSMSVTELARRPYNGGATFQNSDTLLASITPSLENGKTAFVDFLQEGEAGFGSTEFIVMRAKENVSPQFVYCAARDEEIRERAIRSMVGSSGRQRVRRDFLGNYQIKTFAPETMQQFDERTNIWFKQIRANIIENQKLTCTRDYLLPKLMSGEIELKEFEEY